MRTILLCILALLLVGCAEKRNEVKVYKTSTIAFKGWGREFDYGYGGHGIRLADGATFDPPVNNDSPLALFYKTDYDLLQRGDSVRYSVREWDEWSGYSGEWVHKTKHELEELYPTGGK